MFSRKEQWIIFGTVNALAVLAVVLFPFYGKLAAALPEMPCGMVEHLGMYCPACGGTRAFGALLSLDFASSFDYNPIVLVGAGLFVAYEAGMIKHLVRGGQRPTLIRLWVVFAVLAFWLAFFIARNVLLSFGIDTLGDVLV